jgi:hypothetical protein
MVTSAAVKGFPNQAVDLAKLAAGMRALIQLLDSGQNPRDDDVFGPALVRANVAGTGHGRGRPVEQYIRQQLALPRQRRSFGATARGLRELYELFGFIQIDRDRVWATELGRQAAAYAGAPLTAVQIAFWRRAVRNMSHDGGDREESHPYQVLLHLVGRKPGITRAKCALALEAKNDSIDELERIVRLADLPEEEILRQIREARATQTAGRATQANWDNAKKVLPSLAEQLGDVVVTMRGRERTYRLAAGPGQAAAGGAPAPVGHLQPAGRGTSLLELREVHALLRPTRSVVRVPPSVRVRNFRCRET